MNYFGKLHKTQCFPRTENMFQSRKKWSWKLGGEKKHVHGTRKTSPKRIIMESCMYVVSPGFSFLLTKNGSFRNTQMVAYFLRFPNCLCPSHALCDVTANTSMYSVVSFGDMTSVGQWGMSGHDVHHNWAETLSSLRLFSSNLSISALCHENRMAQTGLFLEPGFPEWKDS